MKTILKNMKEGGKKIIRKGTIGFLLFTLALSLKISAQMNQLPKAETLFATFIEKTGGERVYDQIQNRVTISKMVMVNPMITGVVTSSITKTGEYYISIDSTAIGKLENGSNGKIVWDINPFAGPKVIEGKERSRMLCLNSLYLPAQWKTAFKNIECTGIDTIDGKPAYKVEAVNREDYTINYYFDKESGLIDKMELPVETLAGQSIQEIFLGNYRIVDGIQFPYTQRRIEQGREMTLTFLSVRHNADIPQERFYIPEKVQKIIRSGN